MISDAGGPLNFNCRHPAFLIVVHQLSESLRLRGDILRDEWGLL